MTVDVLGSGRHPDLPNAFVHFTGRPRGPEDDPPSFASGTAEKRLVRILVEGRILAASSFASPPVVCVSEASDAAIVAMLKTGVSTRGRYAPWGVLISRKKAIAHGARPALYLSRREQTRWQMGMVKKPKDELTEGRFVTYRPPSVDWTHEREWRFCFNRGSDEPAVSLSGLIVGVITGSKDWYPPPAVTHLGHMTHSKYAGCCDTIPRFLWTGEDLVVDGTFYIPGQMLMGP